MTSACVGDCESDTCHMRISRCVIFKVLRLVHELKFCLTTQQQTQSGGSISTSLLR